MHPLERWFEASLGPIFRISLLFTLALMAVLAKLDSGLKSELAPLGIISFELAGERAPEVLASFGEAARRDALLLQGLDYLYLFLYSTTFASAVLLVARRLAPARSRLSALGRPVAWLQTVAALCDAVENVPLILMLRSGSADPSGAAISRASAIAKFSLLGVGVVYLLAGALLITASKYRARSQTDTERK